MLGSRQEEFLKHTMGCFTVCHRNRVRTLAVLETPEQIESIPYGNKTKRLQYRAKTAAKNTMAQRDPERLQATPQKLKFSSGWTKQKMSIASINLKKKLKV